MTGPSSRRQTTDTAKAYVPLASSPLPVGVPDLNTVLLPAGDAASDAALSILGRILDETRNRDILIELRTALLCLKTQKWKEAGDHALKVLNIDETHSQAWHVLGISREKCGDFLNSLQCYDKALIGNPENLQIGNDLGRLAYRMEMYDLAISLFSKVLEANQDDMETINNIASALRELNRMDDAIALLKPALGQHPKNAQLWNTLATMVNAKGDCDTALIFYDEAVRLQPDMYHAIYNRAQILYGMGEFARAIADLTLCSKNFTEPHHRANAEIGLAHALLGTGQLKAGWQRYLDREDAVASSNLTAMINRPRYKSGESLAGKHVLVCGEQGLGDEVMMGTVLPDLVRELGPKGRLSLGVEPRLVPLFKRAFPEAKVYGHATGMAGPNYVRYFPDLEADHDIDQWMFMGELLRRYRDNIQNFPDQLTLFQPDPERISHWKAYFATMGPEPKVGILWKSLINHSSRDRYFSPFAQWQAVLETQGVHFINLQYGDVAAEMEAARALGLNLHTPPDIDLKNDLDELSALCCGLDLVIGPSNATSNIAAAVGTPIWIAMTPHQWTCLGTDHYPWYPKARTFMTDKLDDWSRAMHAIEASLKSHIVGKISVSLA